MKKRDRRKTDYMLTPHDFFRMLILGILGFIAGAAVWEFLLKP